MREGNARQNAQRSLKKGVRWGEGSHLSPSTCVWRLVELEGVYCSLHGLVPGGVVAVWEGGEEKQQVGSSARGSCSNRTEPVRPYAATLVIIRKVSRSTQHQSCQIT